MVKRWTNSTLLLLGALAFCASAASAQIAVVERQDGRQIFVNADPPRKLAKIDLAQPASAGRSVSVKPSATIYMPVESSLTGRRRPDLDLDRDGAEKLVREAAERHRVDPALIRAVIETESNWNPTAVSRKGARGLMQLIPSTAQRFGVNDMFNPKQNVDAGVRYLKMLLERYNGNLDLALAAYNAGEGAVDRAHGIPAFRETRMYVQRVQDAYFRPGSGRLADAFTYRRTIRKETDASGRIIFTNE